MNPMRISFDSMEAVGVESSHDRIRRAFDPCLAFAIPLLGVIALCRFFSPHWQTNDDVAMSMIAHGYGNVVAGSPNLVFSNVLWGYFVRSLPSVDGLLGYSIATFASLIAAGIAIMYGARLSTRNWLFSIALLGGVLVFPVLFPQFTVNAGFLMIAALVCWRMYDLRGGRSWLLFGCIFAFCGFLVRNQEAFLVFVIGSPLLPWARLLRNRGARFAGVGLVLAMGLATFANRQAYQGEEWHAFTALNPLRLKITDYGANKVLQQSPELLQRYGFSKNDIDLLSAWFFADPNIADPQRLKPMLAQIPSRSTSELRWERGLNGIRVLGDRALFPMLLAALLLALLYADRRILATWLLCIASIFALAVLFRPGVLRVYLPLVSLLFLAPLIANALANRIPRWRWHLAQGIAVVSMVYITTAAFAASRETQALDARNQQDMQDLPHEAFVIWGGSISFQALYPPLQHADAIPKYRMEVFGSFALAPFSLNAREEAKGNGFVQRLQAPNGVLLIAKPPHLEYLSIYCRERLGGELAKESQTGRLLLLKRVRCVTPRNQESKESRVSFLPAEPEATNRAVGAEAKPRFVEAALLPGLPATAWGFTRCERLARLHGHFRRGIRDEAITHARIAAADRRAPGAGFRSCRNHDRIPCND